VSWLYSRIESKLDTVFELAAGLFSRGEGLQRTLKDKLSRSHSCSLSFEDFLKAINELMFEEDDSLDSRIELAVLSAQLKQVSSVVDKVL